MFFEHLNHEVKNSPYFERYKFISKKYRNALIKTPWVNRVHELDLNIYMTEVLTCTILCDLSELL